jgi:hypothetical protein
VRVFVFFRVFFVAVLALSTAACVQNHHRLQEALARPADREARILVLPVDVELFELSFGGAPLPRQDWTVAARENMNAALKAHFGDRSIAVTFHDGELEDEETAKLMRLHASIGLSIKSHQYDGPDQLPTKKGRFDWTMGPEVRRLARSDQADYVLFVHVRDSYSGGGRVAAQVLAAVLFGVALPGGIQNGFASMVDLNTGNFVWYNRLLRDSGDLRTEAPAKETIVVLLTGMPQ